VSAEPPGITGAVDALTAAQDPVTDVIEAGVGQHRGAEFGLAAHHRPLLGGQRTALVEDLRGDLIAAHVRQHRGQPDPGDRFLLEAHGSGRELSEMPHETAAARPVADAAELAALGSAGVADEYQSQLS